MITLNVNGKRVQADAEADTPLLWVLRDYLNMTGTKFGCGMALCGACTVHVDGQPTRSCTTPASAVVGKKVVTVERMGKPASAPLYRRHGWPRTSRSAATASPGR